MGANTSKTNVLTVGNSITFDSSQVTLSPLNKTSESDPNFNQQGPPIRIKGGGGDYWLKARDLPNEKYIYGTQPALSSYTFQISSLPNITNLDQLAKSVNYNPNIIKTTFSVRLTGRFNGCICFLACCGTDCAATLNVRLLRKNGWTGFYPIFKSTTNAVQNIDRTVNVPITEMNLQNYSEGGEIQICPQWDSGCVDSGMDDIYIYMRCNIQIDMNLYCNIYSNFNSQVCKNFCLSPFNEQCTPLIENNCFTKQGTNTLEPIFNDQNMCQGWIKENISKGGSTIIDDKITTLCKNINIDGSNYDKNGSLIQNLCSCHLSPEIYDTYYSELAKKVPGLNLSNVGNARCLFPGCSVSDYPTVTILGEGECPGSNCIQGITINNNGSFNGEVNIDPKCITIIEGATRCTTNSDCADDENCTGATSVQNSGVCIKKTPTTCTTDVQCGTGKRCNTTTGKCEDNPNFVCTTDIQCGTGKKCNTTTGKCETISTNNNNILYIGLGVGGGVVVLIIIVILFYIFFIKKK